MGMVHDDPTTDPRGVALAHEGYLACVLLDGVTTGSYSTTPAEPGDDARYAGAEPVLGWVAECTCGWRGPEYLAVLHPPADPLSGVAPPELDEVWRPAWHAHIEGVLEDAYGRPAPSPR
jgi:hypothetical protein